MLQERSVLEDILLQRTPRGILKRTRCQTVEEALEPWRHVEQRGPCGGLEGCASTETAVVVLPPQVEVPAIPFRYSGDDCKLIGLRVRRFPLSELPLEEELNIIQDQKVGCGGVACTAYQSNKSAPTRASAFCNWAAETGCGRTQIHEYPYVVDSPPSPTSTRAERWLLVDTVESSDLGGGGTVISDTQSERSLLLPALAHVSGGDRDNSQQKVYSFTPALDTVNEERRRPVPSLSGGFRAITLAREGSARHPQTPSKPWDPVDQGQPESVIA
ncbi:glutamine glutamic acid rich protein [Cystoisospora suis]|uniref:Glutamine glutamic acid rich protein n=1 Tax=Cystoisospora suis TaxID=483139 RepID=A0A2C6JXQ3_9APIC|nr:glutamine glutamic acid rich protein [Cystoisospora suis]